MGMGRDVSEVNVVYVDERTGEVYYSAPAPAAPRLSDFPRTMVAGGGRTFVLVDVRYPTPDVAEVVFREQT